MAKLIINIRSEDKYNQIKQFYEPMIKSNAVGCVILDRPKSKDKSEIDTKLNLLSYFT